MPPLHGRESPSHLEKDLDQNSINPRVKSERSLEEDKNFFWVKVDGQQKLATENLVIGNQVYQEKLVTKKGIEYRLWDPFRSKLAAAIMNGLEIFPFKEKSKVLYLGVSTGTTVSHISDIVGPRGIIFGVEHASRDARQPQQYFSVYSKVAILAEASAHPAHPRAASWDRFIRSSA